MSDDEILSLLKCCYAFAAKHSDDRSNQNAAILIAEDGRMSFAANRLPPGVEKLEERIVQRPTKYAYVEHAERGVIYEAARAGICTAGSTMICPWYACADCARAIKLAGVKQVIGHLQRQNLTPDRWSGSVNHGDVILKESGINCLYYDGTIDGLNVLVNEQLTQAI